jgi:hypothetical protein
MCASRNTCCREARGTYVFSLDDDAYYTDPATAGLVVSLFEDHPEAAALALSFIEPGRPAPGAVPASAGQPCRSFTGCAHAVRREAFLDLGGYRDYFDGWGEERDFCLRLLNAGSSVLFAATPPIVHLASPVRDKPHMDFHAVRNTLLFDLLNIPHPYVLPRAVADTLRLLTYRVTISTLPRRVGTVARALWACRPHRGDRKPVESAVYRLFRERPRHGPEPWPDGAPVPPPCRRMNSAGPA